MATNLRALNRKNGGAIYAQTGVSTNWLEIQLPNWAKLVTIQPTNQAIYFSYDDTDGAAVGVQRFPQAVDSIIQYNPMQTSGDRSVFVASQTGTATIYFIFE
tara:strand:- start:569 stop:874 length:306 start_codon:yes stop_codon:yes gene_type:complete